VLKVLDPAVRQEVAGFVQPVDALERLALEQTAVNP
jgi:hypothetical protein